MREHIERQTRCLELDLRPALADHGIRIVSVDDVSAEERRALDERFRRQIFPVLTPLAVGLGRPFPYISNLSLSLGVLVRDPVTGGRDVRAREGAEGDAAALRADRRRLHLRAARGPDRQAPRHAVPGHGDRRLRRLPRDPRRRLHGLRRGRRPAPGGRGRAAPAALRRRRARRGRRRHEPGDPRAAHGLARGRAGGRLRRARPARPRGPVGHRRRARLRRAARPAVDAGHAAAPAGRRVRQARRAGRHAARRHPAPPPVRLVRHLGRALRRAGGQRPERARDQADRVPHERRLAARAGADPRRRARQAGGLRGGGQGALRRAREPAGGRARWRSRACTSSTASRR